jgi:transposase
MRDAEAIAEAVTRPTMRVVPIKAVDHQDIQALPRIRERLLGARTALVNAVHGLMHEYGMVIPKGIAKFRQICRLGRGSAQPAFQRGTDARVRDQQAGR